WGPRGDPPSLGRSLVRAVGTAIAIIPLFAGYLPVLFDRRRRGLPDFLAGTVVVYDDGPEVTPDEPRSSRG
ncbi:MAG TPA: RDD family protein, partial [Gaiellaceae bacterium]|nr:RDD family protein [Gaiellaceae bacterium]